MKYLVETPGDFMLLDLVGGQQVAAFRPTVVEPTPFIEKMIGKRLTKLDVLTDEASDRPLALAKTEVELDAAIAALPRETKPAAKPGHKPSR